MKEERDTEGSELGLHASSCGYDEKGYHCVPHHKAVVVHRMMPSRAVWDIGPRPLLGLSLFPWTVFPGACSQEMVLHVPFPPLWPYSTELHRRCTQQWLFFCISPFVMSRLNYQSFKSSSRNDFISCTLQAESNKIIQFNSPSSPKLFPNSVLDSIILPGVFH